MFEIEFTKLRLRSKIPYDYKKAIFIKRFFCKRGVYVKWFNWISLYKSIQDFKLIFKFKYSLETKTISAVYIPKGLRWFNQMKFLQLYIKIFKNIKWKNIPIKKTFLLCLKIKKFFLLVYFFI